MIVKLIDLLKNPKYTLNYLISGGKFDNISDEKFIKLMFKRKMGYHIDLSNPETFNEKIQWLKLYDKNPMYTKLVDKYEVREYIAQKIGDKYLIPLYGVYNNFEEIDFTKLPSKFVLKPTHTSGNVFICEDKEQINYKKLKLKIKKWLKREYFWFHREWPYKNVPPRIIAEKYMEDEKTKDLFDYKLMVFNGKVECTLVASNRRVESQLAIDFYDRNWNQLPFGRPNKKRSSYQIEKPVNYQSMIEFAELFAADIPFVRVDFYEVDGNLYFGELTLYPGAGTEKFEPESYDKKLGDLLLLPKNMKTCIENNNQKYEE